MQPSGGTISATSSTLRRLARLVAGWSRRWSLPPAQHLTIEALLRMKRRQVEGLAKQSARCRKSCRRNTARLRSGKLECGAEADRYGNGAYCPRVSVVMGDVIDIGESIWRLQPPGRYPV
jgi:hypothetical protein